jgi:hypothetical protein
MMANHIPALKISPTTSQLVKQKKDKTKKDKFLRLYIMAVKGLIKYETEYSLNLFYSPE